MPILHWLTREEDLLSSGRAPYRLLEHVETYGDANTENMLIQGDNLEGLKALLPYYAGKVKCIYIDPPYNTRSAFEHYDDNMEHTQWLSMMYPRLELLRDLLSGDGSIWVSIDDNEAHYLKLIMDEIFGRNHFIANVIWQKKYAPSNDSLWLSSNHDHILCYAKDKNTWRPNKLSRTAEQNSLYKNPDNDPRGLWMSDNYTCAKTIDERPNLYYSIKNPNTGEEIWPQKTRVWAFDEEHHKSNVEEGLIYWGKDGKNSTPRLKKFLANLRSQGRVCTSIWTYEEVGHTQDAKRELMSFNNTEVFATPKPERLLKRIFELSTIVGDLVLDSFLGSGTAAAVAHKMGRQYIGIEIGDHAVTHCIPRLQKVIDGEQGGISKAVEWNDGGGFRFYRLGQPIFDEDGQIRSGITFPQLAAHIWFSETKTPWKKPKKLSPLLGVHNDVAYYLLYNGILGDKRAAGGNVLTSRILDSLPSHSDSKIVYGERSLFGNARLAELGIVFKHTPYEIKGR